MTTNRYDYIGEKLTEENCLRITSEGFTVIDDILNVDDAQAILQELEWLAQHDFLKPNKTHFASSTIKGQYSLFSKPGFSSDEYNLLIQ